MIQQKLKNLFKTPQRKVGLFWLLPLAVLYYELLFRGSTFGSVFNQSILCLIPFTLSFGLLLCLLTTLFAKPFGNRLAAGLLLGLLPLPYLVEFFVFKEFRVYYDLTTVFVGTEDAVGGFMQEIIQLIFSWNGLSRIFLFYLPLLLYVVFLRRRDAAPRGTWKKRCVICAASAALFGLGLLSLNLQPSFGLVYGREYSFQSATNKFGLVTGVRLDVRQLLKADDNSVVFENTSLPPVETKPTVPVEPVTEELPTEPSTYGKNELDLDFDELAKAEDKRLTDLDAYVAEQIPSSKNEFTGLFAGKNLIFITAEAFAAEVVRPDLTPTLYRMATKGFQFLDYDQPSGSGTTGGEFQNVFGLLATEGGNSFKITAQRTNYLTLGYQLNELGYYGKAYHNGEYEFYDRHLTHNQLGYSDGFMAKGNGLEEILTPQWPASDLEMFQGTVPTYIDKPHFNIYYMTISGHCSYHQSDNACTRKNWDRVAGLGYSYIIRGYLAAQLELEDSMTYLLEELERHDLLDDTVIVIAPDHFPYGLDAGSGKGMPYLAELYGKRLHGSLDWDHNGLIIWSGCLEKMDPVVISSPVGSVDILPTMLNLFGIDFDSRLLPGRDVFSDTPALMFDLFYNWKTDYGSFMGGKFTPKEGVTDIPEDYVEKVKAVVRNKVTYCKAVLEVDYFKHVFEDGLKEERP